MGTSGEEIGYEGRDTFDDVLKIIEQEQHVFIPDASLEPFHWGPQFSLNKTKSLNDRRGNQTGLFKWRQRNEKNTICEISEHFMSCRKAQARLANPRWANHIDETNIWIR